MDVWCREFMNYLSLKTYVSCCLPGRSRPLKRHTFLILKKAIFSPELESSSKVWEVGLVLRHWSESEVMPLVVSSQKGSGRTGKSGYRSESLSSIILVANLSFSAVSSLETFFFSSSSPPEPLEDSVLLLL